MIAAVSSGIYYPLAEVANGLGLEVHVIGGTRRASELNAQRAMRRGEGLDGTLTLLSGYSLTIKDDLSGNTLTQGVGKSGKLPIFV